MARSRFLRLPPVQRTAILEAAMTEFAAYGFDGASLNRIIAAAGISKGSMYYYFDGKDDLYAEVVRSRLDELFRKVGPIPVPDAAEADAFWTQVEDVYSRLVRTLLESPDVAALLRDWLARSPASVGDVERGAVRETLPWVSRTVAAGQAAGAVRSDVPAALLIEIVIGMGRAMDSWIISQPQRAADVPDVVHTLVGMMRGALAPPGQGFRGQRPIA